MNSIMTPKRETKIRSELVAHHRFLRGLSLEQRHPKGPQTPPFTPPNSTHLHPTHGHLQ
jgi:hypothetical protein